MSMNEYLLNTTSPYSNTKKESKWTRNANGNPKDDKICMPNNGA